MESSGSLPELQDEVLHDWQIEAVEQLKAADAAETSAIERIAERLRLAWQLNDAVTGDYERAQVRHRLNLVLNQYNGHRLG